MVAASKPSAATIEARRAECSMLATGAATVMVQQLGVSDDHRVYRDHLRTTTDALRAFIEIAVTIRDPDSAE